MKIRAIFDVEDGTNFQIEYEQSSLPYFGVKLESYELMGDPQEPDFLGFCPCCGEKIDKGCIGEDEYDYGAMRYHCDQCGCDFNHLIEPMYKVGEYVTWNDPCKDVSESDTDYLARCKERRLITDILRCETDGTTYDIIYELDNGTEVYETEIDPCN